MSTRLRCTSDVDVREFLTHADEGNNGSELPDELEGLIRRMLAHLGEDPDRPGLIRTP